MNQIQKIEETFVSKYPVDANKYSVEEPDKCVKEEFEANDFNEDNKYDFKTIGTNKQELGEKDFYEEKKHNLITAINSKNPVNINKYSLDKPVKGVKQEFEVNECYDDNKHEFKTARVKKQEFNVSDSIEDSNYGFKNTITNKQEFKAHDSYDDNKHDIQTIRPFELINVIDNKACIYKDENLAVKSTPEILSTNKNMNLVGKAKVTIIEKNAENRTDVNRTYAIVEDRAIDANYQLTTEELQNTEKKRYAFAHCGYSTIKRKGLQEHLLTHSNRHKYVCAHCNLRTTSKTSLRTHILTIHLPNNIQVSGDSTANTYCVRSKPLKCASCDVSYIKRYSLVTHIKRHHGKSKNKGPSCTICNFSSLNPSIMKNHALTHSIKSFKCEKCQTLFSRKDAMKRHTLMYHLTEIPFRCQSCNRKFATRFGLLRYQQLLKCAGTGKAKTASRRFQCTYCTKAFVYKSVLSLHILSHTKLHTFECSHCAQHFPTYTLLRYHIYSHSTEFRFRCSFCNFSTDHQSTMETHEAHNHRKRTPYQCVDCNYLTRKCDLFKTHRAEHNGKGKLQCEQCNYSTDNRQRIIKHVKLHIM